MPSRPPARKPWSSRSIPKGLTKCGTVPTQIPALRVAPRPTPLTNAAVRPYARPLRMNQHLMSYKAALSIAFPGDYYCFRNDRGALDHLCSPRRPK